MYQVALIGESATLHYQCDCRRTAEMLACEMLVKSGIDIMDDSIAASAILNFIEAEKYAKAIEVWNFMNPDNMYVVTRVRPYDAEDIDIKMPEYERVEYQACPVCEMPLGCFGCTHVGD